MERFESLTQIFERARDTGREIRFIYGEKDETALTFDEVWNRALHLLGALQAQGMKSGDQLVIFTRSNENFVIAFWAAILGGICLLYTSDAADDLLQV